MTVVARREPHPDLLARRASGTPAEVAAIVAHVRRSGRLVSMTTPRLLPDGRVFVDVTHLARPPRRRWHTAAVAAVLTGMAVNVWRDAGTFAFLMVSLAGAGLWLVVAAVMAVSGLSAVHHAKQMEQAIAAIEASRRRRVVTAVPVRKAAAR